MLDAEVGLNKGWTQRLDAEVGHRGWTQRLDAEVGHRGWTQR